MAESLCQTCKHTLTLSLPDKTVHVWADRGRLTRAIYNLIANAVRHTTESSVISLRLIRTATVAIIEVHDPAEPGSRICGTTHASEDERYLQIVGADAGFGFAIARAVARAHGGTLIVGAETTAAQRRPSPSRYVRPTRRRRSSTCREPNLTIPAASARS